MRLATTLVSLGLLLLASAPAWADGAPNNDCTGKELGAACYDFDWKTNGICQLDEYGFVECVHVDAGTGGTTSTGSGGFEISEPVVESGCSMRAARALGGPEAVGLFAFAALCAALQRRRRR